MNQNEFARNMGRMLTRARQAANQGGSGGGRGGAGGRPPNFGAFLGGSGAVFALVGGGLLLNSALYNVGPSLLSPPSLAVIGIELSKC